MAKKNDISANQIGSWDQYKAKPPEEVLSLAYANIERVSDSICGWYWASIKTKRITSLVARGIAFALLICGTALPLVAAMFTIAEHKLILTQLGLVLLAMAGLLQVADKVFGWSTGWMRYISTVTNMENLRRNFRQEWDNYLVLKQGALNSSDACTLFELAKQLEYDLSQLQSEETNKWIAEFNAGISLLDSVIKSQRDNAGKQHGANKNEPIKPKAQSAQAADSNDTKQ